MFDIVTFGSATCDIFLKSKGFSVAHVKKFVTGEGIALPLGSKIPVDDVVFTSGGGGTNAAATLESQGFKVAYCGAVGDDFFSKIVFEDLKHFGIDSSYVKRVAGHKTNISFALIVPNEERTILVFKDASEMVTIDDVPWHIVKNAKWIYLSPMSGKLSEILFPLLRFAKDCGVKVLSNPGSSELSLSSDKLKEYLSMVDILVLNQEEAAILTKKPMHKEDEIFKALDDMISGIAIMTKGPLGCTVSDNAHIFRSTSLISPRVVDPTGAGDAFSSGFLSGYIFQEGKDNIERISYAIQMGAANAVAALQDVGAKYPLLKRGDSIYKWGKVSIKVEKAPNYSNK